MFFFLPILSCLQEIMMAIDSTVRKNYIVMTKKWETFFKAPHLKDTVMHS